MRIIENIKNWDGEEWFFGSLGFLVIFGLLGCVVLGINAIVADGDVERCYIEYTDIAGTPDERFEVRGYRAWRPDRVLGFHQTGAGAAELLLEVCPVGGQK